MHSKWACWTPVTNIKLCNNQRASTSSRDTFNQGETVFAVYKIVIQGHTHFLKCLNKYFGFNKFYI